MSREDIFTIAIDGPAGSGKGTIAKELSKILNYHYLDSGAIYRVIALAIHNKKLEFNQEKKIRDFAKKQKLEFISTPFSREAAKKLFRMGVPAFKIGSGECNNLPLVEYICKFKKPIFLSTGMNDIASIKKTVKIIKKYNVPYAILHCTNIYPTPYNLVRLNALKEIKKAFPEAILGLSDHTGDNYTSFAAVALGATVIEKHFIDTKKRSGPDISASIDKTQLKDLIDGVKKIYLSMPGKKRALKEEKGTINFAFASVVAIKKIKKGLNFRNIYIGSKSGMNSINNYNIL